MKWYVVLAAVALLAAVAKSVSRAFNFFSLAIRLRSAFSRAEMVVTISSRKPFTLLVFKNPRSKESAMRRAEIPINVFGMAANG